MEATRQAVMGQGLPPEPPWVVFDYPLFLVDSDLTPIKEKFDEIVDVLTKWQSKNNKTGVFNKSPVEVSGSDYEDALARANYLFLKNNWGDGLAIFPPTKSRRWPASCIYSRRPHKGAILCGRTCMRPMTL